MSPSKIFSPNVYFFDVGHYNPASELKSFVTYLKYQKIPAPLIFSHIESEGKLINKMTLLENILLALPTLSKSNTSEDFLHIIKKTNNESLLCLYNQITDFHAYPENVTCNTIKLIQIIKGLLIKSKYIFVDLPELNLMDHQLSTFAQALELNAKLFHQTIFVRTNLKIHFKNATQIIQRLPDGTFIQNQINVQSFKSSMENELAVKNEGYLKFFYTHQKNQA